MINILTSISKKVICVNSAVCEYFDMLDKKHLTFSTQEQIFVQILV